MKPRSRPPMQARVLTRMPQGMRPWTGMLMMCLLGACASSRNPTPDRQTHWVQVCEPDPQACASEPCEACVCAWAWACVTDADCTDMLEGPATCTPRDELEPTACQRSDAGSVCVPADAAPEPEDARPPLALTCAELREDPAQADLERVVTTMASGAIIDFDAADDAIFFATPEAIMRADAGEDGEAARVVADVRAAVGGLATDGRDVVWGETDTQHLRLWSLPEGETRPVELSRRPANGDPTVAVTLSRDHAFWLADGTLLRSPRAAGPAEPWSERASYFLPQTLSVGPGHVYFVRIEPPFTLSARRVPVTERTVDETLVEGPVSGMAVVEGEVYVTFAGGGLSDGSTDAGPARVERLTLGGAGADLLAVLQGEPLALAADASNLYWLEANSLEVLDGTLWQMPRDGSRAPEALLTTNERLTTKIVAPGGDSKHLYLSMTCLPETPDAPLEQHLLRLRTRAR